ncbi:MAG TPA: MFS transporter [Microbacteriaceae bacterium]|nr:MFS transporter [Microbacteriaceae bacterium]
MPSRAAQVSDEDTAAIRPASAGGAGVGRVVTVLMAGTFLMGTTEFLLAGLLPEIAADFHTSVARAGLTVTVFAAGMIVGAPTVSLFTLRLPRRWTLALALGLFALGHAIAALTGSFDVVLAARFLTGVATGAFWSVGSAVAARVAGPAARSRTLGLVLGGGMIANVVGVPLGAFAGQAIGWRSTFWALAGLAVVAGLAVALAVPANRGPATTPSLRAEFRVLLDGRFWLVLAMCGMVNGAVLSMYSYLAPMTRRAGLPDSAMPFILMAFGAAALIGSIAGGRLGDRHPYLAITLTASVSLVAAAGVAAFGAHPVALVLFFSLLGLVGLSSNPALVSLALRFGGAADTMASAMPASTFNLGTAIGTGVTGAALATSLGAFSPPLVAAVAATLIFGPLAVLLARDRRTQTRRAS